MAENEQDALVEPEAEEDVAEQLRRFDEQAAGADPLGGTYGFGVPEDFAALGAEADAGAGSSYEKAKTLDDLYDRYPDIGTEKFLRIERKEPPKWRGAQIAGWLEDLHQQLTMNEFADRFGGGVYEVHVMGPGRGYEESGEKRVRTIESMRLKIPGYPKIKHEVDMTPERFPPQSHPEVEVARLKMQREQAREDRAEAQRLQHQLEQIRSGHIPTEVMQQVESMGRQRAEEVKRQFEESLSQARAESERLRGQLEESYEKINSLRETVTELRAELSAKVREAQDSMRSQCEQAADRKLDEMRLRHEHEIERLKTNHQAEVDRIQAEQKTRYDAAVERWGAERKEAEENRRREIDRLMADGSERERRLTETMQQRERDLRETYESRLAEAHRQAEQRIKDVERAAEREIRTLKDQRDRELESIRTMEGSKAAMAQESANLQMERMNRENEQLRDELKQARAELSELQQKMHKPVLEQIKESHALAEATGFSKGSEEQGDWKHELFKTVRDAVPEVAKSLGDRRKDNQRLQQQRMEAAQRRQHQMTASQQQHAARQTQQRGAQAPHGPAAAGQQPNVARAQYRQNLRQPPPPNPGQAWDDHALPPVGQPIDLSPPTSKGPVEQVKRSTQVAAEAPAREPSWSAAWEPSEKDRGFGPFADEPKEEQKKEDDDASTHQTSEPPSAQPSAAFTEEMVNRFASQLDAAIRTRAVEPAEFASAIIDEAGADAVKPLVDSVDPGVFCDRVEQSPGGSKTAIITPAGREYVEHLWQAAKEQIG